MATYNSIPSGAAPQKSLIGCHYLTIRLLLPSFVGIVSTLLPPGCTDGPNEETNNKCVQQWDGSSSHHNCLLSSKWPRQVNQSRDAPSPAPMMESLISSGSSLVFSLHWTRRSRRISSTAAITTHIRVGIPLRHNSSPVHLWMDGWSSLLFIQYLIDDLHAPPLQAIYPLSLLLNSLGSWPPPQANRRLLRSLSTDQVQWNKVVVGLARSNRTVNQYQPIRFHVTFVALWTEH